MKYVFMAFCLFGFSFMQADQSCNNVLRLHEDEIEVIEGLVERLSKRFNSIENEEFADECQLVAHEIPYRVRKILNDFRNQRSRVGYLRVEGFLLDNEAIGPTPAHWDAPWNNSNTLREEVFQCLLSSCAGDIFGWLTQENGRYLRHVVPIEKDKNEQLGGSSAVVLVWHVEEAFHPQRADMMTIMCYRNNEKAGTNLCAVSNMEIPEQYWQILSEPRFFIHPDKSHLPQNNESQHWQLNNEHFLKIKSFLEHPEPIAVLQGKKGDERLVIDEAFMEALPGDLEAKEALDWLYQHMYERRNLVVMKPGDILFIDNRLAAHGRTPYVPQYGPHARWLRRVNITADLTKSYQWKDKPYGRTIF